MIENSRRIAFETLCDVLLSEGYSNLILPRRLNEAKLDRRDAAFTTEIVYGTLRMKKLLDHFLSTASVKPITEVDPKVLIVLEIGCYESLMLKHPAHAVVNETVELAKAVVGKAAATFVNALLRKVTSQENSIESIENLGIRYSHPEWIINSYRDSLREEGEVRALLAANNEPPVPTL